MMYSADQAYLESLIVRNVPAMAAAFLPRPGEHPGSEAPYSIESLVYNTAENIIDWARNRYHYSGKILFAATTAPVFNAVAIDEGNGPPAIVLSWGLISSVLSFAANVSDNTQARDYILAGETPKFARPSAVGDRTSAIFNILDKGIDVVGKDLSIYPHLAFCAFIFVVAHEIGHLMNGHIGFRRGVHAVAERPTTGELDELRTSRALEMDADHTGVADSLRYILALKHQKWGSFDYLSEEALLRLFAVAACMVTAAMDWAPGIPWENYKIMSHPPAIFRNLSIFGMMGTILKHWQNPLWDSCVKYVPIAQLVVEEVILQREGGRITWDQYRIAQELAFHCREDALSRWALILPRLSEVKANPFRLARAERDPS